MPPLSARGRRVPLSALEHWQRGYDTGRVTGWCEMALFAAVALVVVWLA
jgi:hypothetical protein